MEYSTLPQPVTTNANVYDTREPAGLEVAPDPGLERTGYEPKVDNHGELVSPGHYYTEPYTQGTYPEAYDGPSPGSALPAGDGAVQKRWSRKWLVIGAIGLVVVLAAVLGGVFGSRAARASSDAATATASATATVSTSNPTVATPTPTSIANDSPLAAVSFVTTGDGSPDGNSTGAVIVILFKDPEGKLRASISQTPWGTGSDKISAWQAPQLVTTTNPAENGTGLAVAGYATSTEPTGNAAVPQYSVRGLQSL